MRFSAKIHLSLLQAWRISSFFYSVDLVSGCSLIGTRVQLFTLYAGRLTLRPLLLNVFYI